MRILALVPGGISDQLLFFPTLDDLQRSLPNAEIDVVVEPRAKSAYTLSKSVNQIIPFDFKDRNSLSDWANLLGIIRDQYYDVAITTRQDWSIDLMLWLTGTPVRIGYSGGAGRLFLTRAVPRKTEQYTAEMYHDLLQGLNITTPCPPLEVGLAKRYIDWAEAQQKQLGIGGSGYVLICDSNAADAANGIAYPIENWQEIVQDFRSKQPDLPLVVVQEPGNEALASTLAQAYPEVKVVQPSSLGQLAAMIAGANLMLCPNSPAMHLAVALKVYTLALFGAEDPKKLLSPSKSGASAEETRFIGLKSPTGRTADISPQMVLQKVWGG